MWCLGLAISEVADWLITQHYHPYKHSGSRPPSLQDADQPATLAFALFLNIVVEVARVSGCCLVA